MANEKFTQSEINAVISEMNQKLEKKNQRIASLSDKIDSINKVVESRVAEKKKCNNTKKQLETENDLLQVKTLRELCNKANISMQEIFAEAFKALMEKVSNQTDEEKQEVQLDVQTSEKTVEDFREGKPSVSSDNIEHNEEEEKNDNHHNKDSLRSRDNAKNENPAKHDLEESSPQKDNGKPVNPVEKAKMEQRERLARKHAASPPKPPSAQKSSLEERLGPYMGR